MKKIFFVVLVQFLISTAAAQINTNLVLAATPPATLSEWGNRREILTYIINTQPGLSFPVIIKTEIKTTDGTVIGTTDLAKAKVITLSSSATILFATDVLPLEIFLFTGKYKTSMQRTGKLPADNYIMCVQLVRPVDFTPASAPVCKNFYLATTQLPILMKPYNEEVLDGKTAQTAITFRWTPVIPKLTDPVTYRLQVFEVLPTQSPMQALRSNQPLLDKEIINATQFIWRPQIPFETGTWGTDTKNINSSEAGVGTGKDKKTSTAVIGFIWTIQSLDKGGNPVTRTDGNGEGRSEPIVFFVDPQKKKN